jgi:hypothetical protein
MKKLDIRKKLYKLFIVFCICISINGGAIAQSEISKMLESLTGEKEAIIREIDEEEDEIGENKKRKKHKA